MLRAMLRNLLVERCKLVIHSSTAETPIYELVVAKHGPNLREATPCAAIPSGGIGFPEGGGMVPYRTGERLEVRFFETSMTSLAANLSRSSTRRFWTKPASPAGMTSRLRCAVTTANRGAIRNPQPIGKIEKFGLTLNPARLVRRRRRQSDTGVN